MPWPRSSIFANSMRTQEGQDFYLKYMSKRAYEKLVRAFDTVREVSDADLKWEIVEAFEDNSSRTFARVVREVHDYHDGYG